MCKFDIMIEKEVTINTAKTYTKMEYSRAYNMSRVKVDELIKTKDLTTIQVKGVTLILVK